MDRDNLLTYMNFIGEFKIHTEAIYFQLGAVISQKGKPIAFYGRKLTDPHKIYTVTEKDLLSTVETVKEFRTILIGQISRIYTDHKNLTCKRFNTDIFLIWRQPQYQYYPKMGTKILRRSPLIKIKVCQKSITPKKDMNIFTYQLKNDRPISADRPQPKGYI